MDLVPEMTYTVTTANPLPPTRGAPVGAVQYWQVTDATLYGPRIRATLAATGGDWMRIDDDGYWRPHVHAQFVTDDDAVILMEYTGLVQQTPVFTAAADRDEPTGFDDHYLRLHIRFETGAAQYGWLNTSLFVAAGRLLGTGKLEYDIRRVT